MNTNLMLNYMIYAIRFPHANLSMVHTLSIVITMVESHMKYFVTMVAIHIDKGSCFFFKFFFWQSEFDPH